jgi:hypothetical protein
MAPLLKELSTLEVEPLEIVVHAPRREGFYTPPGFHTVRSQDSNLDTLTVTSNDLEVAALLMGTFPVKQGGYSNSKGPCCCCIPCCCCCR